MKKILIITYYWPPTGGSGVQRWLKFAKYLPEFGYEPVIFTPENPSFINMDEALLKEVSPEIDVLKLPIWEPYRLLGSSGHQKNVNVGKPRNWKQKVANWIRGNLFIPDPRMFWVRPAVRFLKDFLPGSGIQTIITTGPPHSMHLIGLALKRKMRIRWVADFRDPWTEWDIMDSFQLSAWARKRHQSLEKRVLEMADRVLSVGWQMDADLKRLGARRTAVITNGFDPADFRESDKMVVPSNDIWLIRHIGTIDEMRNPRPFLETCATFMQQRETIGRPIKVEFIGNVNPIFRKDVEEHSVWSTFVSFHDYVPHNEVIKLYKESHLLLLVLAHSQSAKLNVTGKIFEYIASGVPVLAIGDPEGDGARVLLDSGAGRVANPKEPESLLTILQECLAGSHLKVPNLEDSPYSRRNLTQKLAELLDTL